MSESRTIFLAGGGTGGHLYPGIALAEALRDEVMPNARIVFLCTEREIDRVILQPSGFEFIPQPIVPPRTTIGGLLRFWKSWRETKDLLRKVLRENWPAVVVGLGGYAAGAAVKMAAHRKIVTAILNPDLVPGKANQYLFRYAKAVCCQFPQTQAYVPAEHKAKLHVTGCPIRREILVSTDRASALQKLGLDPALKTLVVTGASLGAKTVNEAVQTVLKAAPPAGWQVLHLAGRDHAVAVQAGYKEISLPSRVIDFTPAMADVWSVADLCISRSGASSCAELTARGVPSILMPYPFHKDMHQLANAKVLADAGAAVLIDDEKDRKKNSAKLRPVMETLMSDATQRSKMSHAARCLGHPHAATAAARVIGDLLSANV